MRQILHFLKTKVYEDNDVEDGAANVHETEKNRSNQLELKTDNMHVVTKTTNDCEYKKKKKRITITHTSSAQERMRCTMRLRCVLTVPPD